MVRSVPHRTVPILIGSLVPEPDYLVASFESGVSGPSFFVGPRHGVLEPALYPGRGWLTNDCEIEENDAHPDIENRTEIVGSEPHSVEGRALDRGRQKKGLAMNYYTYLAICAIGTAVAVYLTLRWILIGFGL